MFTESQIPSMTRILSKPAFAGPVTAGLRSPEELDGSGVGALGGTGVVDRDGVALSLSPIGSTQFEHRVSAKVRPSSRATRTDHPLLLNHDIV